MTITEERIDQAVEKASDAFWAAVVEQFPEIKSGDFAPIDTIVWGTACKRAIVHWLEYNREPDQTDLGEWVPAKELTELRRKAAECLDLWHRTHPEQMGR